MKIGIGIDPSDLVPSLFFLIWSEKHGTLFYLANLPSRAMLLNKTSGRLHLLTTIGGQYFPSEVLKLAISQ